MINLVSSLVGRIKTKLEKSSARNKNISSQKLSPKISFESDSIVDIQNEAIIESIFQNEFSLLSKESNLTFNFLNHLRLQIIDNQIDLELAEEIKNKVLKNKNKYNNQIISELSEDIILRLEIEIAKLETKNEAILEEDYKENDTQK